MNYPPAQFEAMTDGPQSQLIKMRRLATGLLVVMAVLYVLARTLEGSGSFWPWLRAFSEAAMVGAFADWFAVTALFRHPLGLPIPHTAVVRKEQARIGASVASFVRKSFLTPEEVSRQWREWRPLTKCVHRMTKPGDAEHAIRWVLLRLPKVLREEDQKALAGIAASGLQRGVRSLPMARMVTILLRGFLKSPGRRSLLAPMLDRVSQSVANNREWVMDEASKSTKPNKIKIFDALSKAAASAVSGKAVEKFSDELAAASRDEEHPLYGKIEEALMETARELEEGGGGHWEIVKARVLDDPATLETLEEVIQKGAKLILDSAKTLATSESIQEWSESLAGSARRLYDNEEHLAMLEARAGDLAARFFNRYGPGLERIISRTIEAWEPDELIDRLENQVGSDLQFIRINGTLIGGLVGLLLHGIGHLIW